MIANLLSTADTESSVNLTWSLDNQCVVVYHVEVTNTNTSNITNMNTTSQYIVLTLQTGVVYAFRVRGTDSAGRGEWSEPFMYTGESRFQVILFWCYVLLVLPLSLISYSTTAILSPVSIHSITSSTTAMPTSTVAPTDNGNLTMHVCACTGS